MIWNREELAWAAGFYEGEGYCGNRTTKYARQPPIITLAQVNKEPLLRFVRYLHGGRLNGPYHPGGNRKPYYQLSSSNFETTQAMAAFMWPWLSSPKKKQIRKAFMAFYKTPVKKPGRKHGPTTCGHPDYFAKNRCESCYRKAYRQRKKLRVAA